MQKTLAAAAFAAVLGIGGAQAADLNGGSMKDAPFYAPAQSWTGFYLGAGGGGGATNSDLKGNVDFFRLAASAEANGIGGMGGFGTVQVGYDRQLDHRFVVGAFFDYDFAAIDSKLSASASLGALNVGGSVSFNLTNSWTAGGRAGYLFNPSTLVYGLGGLYRGALRSAQGRT